MKRATKQGTPDSAVPSDGEIYITKDGGVIKTILKEGDGPLMPAGSFVTVHYVLKLGDGTEIDSSRSRNKPFSFQANSGSVILGWDKAIPTMKQGERALIKIHPNYGYGNRAMGPMPADSTLFFDCEMIGWSTTSPGTNWLQLVMGLLITLAILYFVFNRFYPLKLA